MVDDRVHDVLQVGRIGGAEIANGLTRELLQRIGILRRCQREQRIGQAAQGPVLPPAS